METSNYINTSPTGIESESMQIITRELSHLTLPVELGAIIKRVVHTTADFEYAHLLEAHPEAIKNAKMALLKSENIYVDTSMIIAGVSKPSLIKLGCEIQCFVHDTDVVRAAKNQSITRSICAINKAAEDKTYKIYVIGNSPTALVRICELAKIEMIKPDLVIGVPVGFVGAAESKEMLKNSGLPYILIRGRKGGSTVGVAILNAILYDLVKRD